MGRPGLDVLRSTGIPADAQLRDVAVADADVWVVGNRANEDGAPVEALAWRYTGTGWTSYRIDMHPGAILNGVQPPAPARSGRPVRRAPTGPGTACC